MSKLHGLADDDRIWDAIHDDDHWARYDRSELGPLTKVVAAELRAQATFLDKVIEKRGTGRATQNANKAFALVARILRDRAAELDGTS